MTNLVKLENELPVFNPESRSIKEFKAVIEKDKGSKGDHDGRKKLIATKELCFVYFFCDYRSPFRSNYSADERESVIKERLDLPDSWKVDSVLKAAMDRYEIEQVTQTMKVLESSRESLFDTQKVIILVQRRLSGRIRQIEENENLLETQPELLDKIIADGDRLNTLAKKIPDQIDILTKLEVKVKTELEAEQFGRAGRKINRHELPS